MKMNFLTNKDLTADQIEIMKSMVSPCESILFCVVGDLSDNAKFGKTLLFATEKGFYTVDLVNTDNKKTFLFCDLESVKNKRMYGNAIMRAKTTDGKNIDVFRYSFAVAELCDASVTFFNEIKEGKTVETALDFISHTYEKMLTICPKCGRALAAPGVPCVHCMNKKKLVMKFAKYVKPGMGTLLVSVFLSFFVTGLALIPPLLTKTLVDDVISNKQSDLLVKIIIALVATYIVRYALSAVRQYLFRKSGAGIAARIRNDVYAKAERLPMKFYDKTSTGSVINRINNDTNRLQDFIMKITQEGVVHFLRGIGIIIVMLCINWRLTIWSLIPVPIVALLAKLFRKIIHPYYHRMWRRSSAITAYLTDTVPGVRVVKAFANEERATEKFEDRVEAFRKITTEAGKFFGTYPAVVNCLVAFGSVVIWSMGGRMVMGGSAEITTGVLVSFISYATMFYEPVNFFANLTDASQDAMNSAERIMDIIDAEPEHDFGKGNKTANMGGRIEFKNVNFSFDKTKKTLEDINLTIEPGDIVGIVGTTGSGKSTLINLLLRYYDGYEGQITVDGQDIRNIDLSYYRSEIGYVQQEPMMFHDTIYNNIAYGDDKYTVDEVINAADIANAHEFIIRQPDGYDTVLGERGIGLSGGERQRISIARAMLRDPKLLVFDEATASVDSETEHYIQEAIERLISDRTTIMIAHRLSTLSKANKIVVVDNGRIIECGTPEELIAKKGKYYRLVEIQSMAEQVAKSRKSENF